MKMKKILLASLALLSLQSAVAEILNGDNKSSIIELDNQHIQICQRQLFVKASKDVYPVILLYAKNDSFSNLFMPTYEDAANSLHSQRQFFRYDAGSRMVLFSIPLRHSLSSLSQRLRAIATIGSRSILTFY